MLIKKPIIVKVAVHGVSYFAGRNLVLVWQDKDNVFQTYQRELEGHFIEKLMTATRAKHKVKHFVPVN